MWDTRATVLGSGRMLERAPKVVKIGIAGLRKVWRGQHLAFGMRLFTTAQDLEAWVGETVESRKTRRGGQWNADCKHD